MVIDDAPLAALTRERMRAVMAPKALWRLAAARGHTGSAARLLRHVLVRLEHLRQSGAGKLRRGQCLPRLPRPSSPRARPACADDELGRARRRRLRRAQRARRRIPRATGHDGTLARRSDVAARIVPRAGSTQAIAIRVDWAKVAAILPQHAGESAASSASSLRSKVRKPPARRATGGAGSRPPRRTRSRRSFARRCAKSSAPCLRVKPDSLRDDQPLTDLGLDSLMGVEIENSLEAAVGVALPPTSLMRARTIGQIASLIAGHLGGATTVAEPQPVPVRSRKRPARSIWRRCPTRTSTACSARDRLRRDRSDRRR